MSRFARPAAAVAASLALAAALAGAARPGQSTGDGIYRGETKPSETVQLAFPDQGQVAEVMIERGSVVAPGDVLMRQDAALEEAQRKELEIEADVIQRVRTAEAQYELARVQRQRIEEQRRGGGSSQLELEEAQLNERSAQLQIAEERRQGEAAKARIDRLEVQIDRKELSSPVSGTVRLVEAQAGEVFGPQVPAVEIVTVDPLDVEVLEMPVRVTRGLKAGDAVEVRYVGEDQWRPATVKFLDPLGAEGFDEQPVVLSLPNPDGLPAKLNVEVRLPGGNGTANDAADAAR